MIPKNRPEPTSSEMFGQLGAVNKKLENWIESTKASSTHAGDAKLTPMTMYKRCLAAYGKVWSNIDDLDKPINSEPALEATGRLCKDLITWAEITGVCSKENVSLDYETRASSKSRRQVLKHVLKPLFNIETALKTMTEIAQEKRSGSLSCQNSHKIRVKRVLDSVAESQALLGI